ncbi:MAG: hypothetical protein CVU79_06930 [Elusimicrobia bacterium HGW-Elusimicrobia-3]|jgi:hypothetical protein|nr:MAG: hypothetical protein CVU79_06930 [Elusimicrobia bacterium HGW-Elusimicrobia-3]
MRTAFQTLAGRLARASGCLRAGRPGQAMTEVVLLFPIFLLIVFITAKIFALLVLMQKLEIAAYYAARRWQLESHLNADHSGWDQTTLLKDPNQGIEAAVRGYIGFDTPAVKKFLNLKDLKIEVVRTQVWNVITITVTTDPAGVKLLCKYPKQAVCTQPYGAACMNGHDYLCQGGKSMEVIKYVPNRDRPIQFVLPGLK